MKVAVFGAGAVGSVLGAHLARGHEVHLVARAPHVEAIRSHGLHIHGVERLEPRLEAHPELPRTSFDLVLVAVKAYDTPHAAKALRALPSPPRLVATVQNGLGNLERLEEALPRSRVLAAPTYIGAILEAPGRIHYTSRGRLLVGATQGGPAEAEALASALQACGLEAAATADIRGALWMKAIVNAAINPLTAIHRVPNGRLLEDPSLRERMRRICLEAVDVARRAGIRLPTEDPVAAVEKVARDTASNRSSMLQSVERGSRTEIEAINGAILAEGRRWGVPCPENQAAYDAVRRLTL